MVRNARAIPRGLSGFLAAFLMALLACQPVLSALPVPEPHGCRHEACPMHRPVQAAAKPSCHGSHAPAPAPVQSGASCSLSASCGCGHPHSPGTPHPTDPAVLAALQAAALPAPAGLASSFPDAGPLVPLPAPDLPPPRA
ncbi:MAG TPA: hypothetical protein VJ725_33705 [Thermoanaerobaculia bacterium]|nr:hypothetical protein [Thermoanaerobaculia bacterium]